MANNSSVMTKKKIQLLKKKQNINNSDIDEFQNEIRRKANELEEKSEEEAAALLQMSEEERAKYMSQMQVLMGEFGTSVSSESDQFTDGESSLANEKDVNNMKKDLRSDETCDVENEIITANKNKSRESEDEGEEENDDDAGDDDDIVHKLSTKTTQSKNALSLLFRELVSTPAAIHFNKIYTIEVSEKCPVVALEGRHVWVAYHVGENTSLEEYSFGGKLTYKIEVEDHVRRMSSDGLGRIFMSCREAQCIKVADASTNSLSTLYTTEGYPNGIFYDFVQNRLLFSENKGPSYFVYGEYGEEWAKIHTISLSSNKHDVIMTQKAFDLGYISSIALNINGDICIADYINDKVCIGTTDGQLKASCEQFRSKHGDWTVQPYEICCDRSGLVFFACSSGKAIYVLSDQGKFIDRLELDFIPNSISVNDKGLLCIGKMNSPEVDIYSYERKYFSA